jgi:transposase
MKQYIGCDVHKKYSMFCSLSEEGEVGKPVRVENKKEDIKAYLKRLPKGTPIAVETTSSWYWLVDEIEREGHKPFLAQAGKAKKMMGRLDKTDKLDALGLAILLRNGTLPYTWIPPKEVRDKRELTRTRMTLARIRTKLKNRIQATLSKHNLKNEEVSDIFGKKGRTLLEKMVASLPPETKYSTLSLLKLLGEVEKEILYLQEEMERVVERSVEAELLKTLPGVGPILSTVIAMEVGRIERFPSPQSLASYSGCVPRVSSSGGKTCYGKTRPDVNRYLKWAFVEAANVCVLQRERLKKRHVIKLYERVKLKRGHGKAVVALARHLAEATYWVLKRKEPYREPKDCFSS